MIKLLRVVLSLMLVVASLAGSAAHARSCDHSGVHTHDTGHHAEHANSAHGGGEHMTAQARHVDCDCPGTETPIAPTHHTDCTDFVCHGGVALLYGAAVLKPESWPQVVVLPWDERAAPPVGPGRLDRPPKSFVSA